MAIVFDAASTASLTLSAAKVVVWSHTVGTNANRLLMVGVGIKTASRSVSSITWGAQGLTFLKNRVRANAIIELWYLKNPDSGTKNITVTFSAAWMQSVVGAASWEGVHQTETFGTAVSADGYGSTATDDASSASGELVVDAVMHDTGTATVGASQTQRYKLFDGLGSAGSSEPGAGTVTMSWSFSMAANWAIAAVPLKPSAADAGKPMWYYQEMMRRAG